MSKEHTFFGISLNSRRRRASFYAILLLWAIIAYWAITRFGVQMVEVDGESMSPTFKDRDRALLHKWMYYRKNPEPGEVVGIKLPDDNELNLKRIIALPLDTIQIKDGQVFVNGHPQAEPYLPEEIITEPGALSSNVYEIAPDCYFVLGDNRSNSFDSRAYGAIPRHMIKGMVPD